MYNVSNTCSFIYYLERNMQLQIPVYSKKERGSVRFVSPAPAFIPQIEAAKSIAKAVIKKAMTDTVVNPVFGCSCTHPDEKLDWNSYMDCKCSSESWKRMRDRSKESNHRNKTCGIRNRRLSIKDIIQAQLH